MRGLVSLLGGHGSHREVLHGERGWRRARNEELSITPTQMHQLSGLLSICSSCKKIRDESGAWDPLESYIPQRSEADFTHSVCPSCIKALYPDYK